MKKLLGFIYIFERKAIIIFIYSIKTEVQNNTCLILSDFLHIFISF